MRAFVKTEVLLVALVVASCGGMKVGGAPVGDGGTDSSTNPAGWMPDGGSGGSNPMEGGSGGSHPEGGPDETSPDTGTGGSGGSTPDGGSPPGMTHDASDGDSTPDDGPDSRNPDSGSIDPGTCVESPSTPNIQALFKFDESAGPEIVNSVPRKFPDGGATANGQIFGAARIPGRSGGALRFGPSGARAEIPMDVPIILNGQITVKFWVRPQRVDAGSQYHLVGNGHYGIATFRISLESGKVVLSVPDSTVWRNIVTATTALSVDRWTHVAVTYDSTRGYVYLDGQEDASSMAIYPLENQYNRLYIGAIDTANFMWEKEFPGDIDDLAILSVAQGPADICKGP
jgi:hypothetical protein